MTKKIVAIVLSLVLVLTATGTVVKASSYCSLSAGSYSGYGSCWISASSAGATTYVNPMAHVEVSATYKYVSDPDTPNATMHTWNKSNGGDGSTSVSFDPGSNYRSYSIFAHHSFSSYDGYSASGNTEAYYP